MSSSQQSSNNSDNNNTNTPANQNPYSDYYIEDGLNPQQQQQMSGYDNRNIMDGNNIVEQIDIFQDDNDEDLPNEIVAELDARAQIQANINDEDESVFSDVVQDAFKKYQNETWDTRSSDDELYDEEQEELYAQMEECWNYMTEENKNLSDPQTSTIDQEHGPSTLNPDATEFKPSWLKSSTPPPPPPPTNSEKPITSPSSQTEEQAKKNEI